jgi:hypothetical protein
MGMVEKVRKTARRWLRRHSLEAVLRLAEGQSHMQLAEVMDFCVDTVRKHIKDEKLEALAAMTLSLERSRLRLELLDAESGAATQARLRASYATLSKLGEPAIEQESDVKTRKAIGEMSDDELRAYVASLVPGLEVKTATGNRPRGIGTDERISVSENGEAGTEATNAGDELA